MKKQKRFLSLQLALLFVLVTILSAFSVLPVAADSVATNGLAAYYSFDGSLDDGSGNGNNGTAVGNISFVDAVNGKGAYFDGSSYIEVKDSPSLDLTGPISISVWLYKGEDKSDHIYPIVKKLGNDQVYSPYDFSNSRDYYNTITFKQNGSESSNIMTVEGTKPVDVEKWTLATITSDGRTVRTYINDKLDNQKDFGRPITPTDEKLVIGFGSYYHADSCYYLGAMDDLRIYNRELTSAEVKGIYESVASKAPVVGMQKKLVAHYTFDGNLKDISGYGNDGAEVGNGVTFTKGMAGTGGAADAVLLDGNSYIEVKDSDSLDLDRSFTFSAWVNPGALPERSTQKLTILAKNSSLIQEYPYTWSVVKNIESKLYQKVEVRNIPDNLKGSKELTEFLQDNWKHMTVVYDGNTFKQYINGKLMDTDTSWKDVMIPHTNGKLFIGEGTNRTVKYVGAIDELKIYNYALTDQEVAGLYGQRNVITVSAPATMTSKQSVALKVTLKPLRGNSVDVTKDSTVVINAKDAKRLKYAKGKLTATGKGKVTVEVRYKNLSVPYTITIK